MSAPAPAAAAFREIVLGSNSKLWRALARSPRLVQRFRIAIGHRDLPRFEFRREDRVWVFAYSRRQSENSAVLERLQRAAVSEVVYVSSATTIVTRLTRCYRYPRVKQLAEQEARQRLGARILSLGIVYESAAELPGGSNAATALASIEEFMLAPHWPSDDGNAMHLFEIVQQPFASQREARLQRLYDAIQWRVRRYPCALRPLDLLLRSLGIRWYGYVQLSNRLWSSTK
ncbi:MAG TPA: hypothetical protein VH814_07565 [Steroidobacteraceae bacterium]|jgi:hypothetical protein